VGALNFTGDNIKEWAGQSQWRAWRADLWRFRKHGYSAWGSEGFWALTIYRLQNGTAKFRPKLLWLPLRAILAVVKKLLTAITHINLHPNSKIGPRMLIPHVGPIQVFPWATIGADCAIHQVCTIGAGSKPGGPVIGDGARIGAGAVVVTDIRTAVGVPARAVRHYDKGKQEPESLGLEPSQVQELLATPLPRQSNQSKD
jgi:serine O-acetyltransferase